MEKDKIPLPFFKSGDIPDPPGKVFVPTKREDIYPSLDKSLKPPSAVDVEKAVLGALIIDTTAAKYIDIIIPEFFFLKRHWYIFIAIRSLYSNGTGIDLLTVIKELEKMGSIRDAGGEQYIVVLCNSVSSAAHLEFHARILAQKYVLREIIHNASKVIDHSYNDDPDIFDVMDSLSGSLENIRKTAILHVEGQSLSSAKDELSKKRELFLSGEKTGVLFGIADFDEFTMGIQDRELITIAARPSMGKTAMGIALVCNMAFIYGVRCAFFSLEISNADVSNRIATRLTGVDTKKIRAGRLNDEEYARVLGAFEYIEKSNITIMDSSEHRNTFEYIAKHIRKLASMGYKVFMVDYVQLVKMAKRTSRTDDLNDVTNGFKSLANELDIIIVILAQLSRDVDKRPGHMPILADLKHSGSIEEDSDTVIFLVRDAYYEEDKYVGVPMPPHIMGDTKFIVAKGRNYGVGNFRVFLDVLNFKVESYG